MEYEKERDNFQREWIKKKIGDHKRRYNLKDMGRNMFIKDIDWQNKR